MQNHGHRFGFIKQSQLHYHTALQSLLTNRFYRTLKRKKARNGNSKYHIFVVIENAQHSYFLKLNFKTSQDIFMIEVD